MRNRRAIFSFLTLSALTLAFIAVACKDDTPSEFTDPKNDGGNVPDRVQGFLTDTGSGFEGSVKVECKPSLPTDFKATFTAPVKKDACTADQIKTYYESCLPELDEQPCTDWLTANADCAKCIEAPDAKGPVQVFAVNNIDRFYYTLNNAGCIGLIQGKTGDDSCAKAYDTAFNCRRQACDFCFAKGGDFKDFTDCQGLASDSNACKEFENASVAKCLNAKPDYKDPDGGAPGCFAASPAEDPQLLFTRLASAFCLKP